MNALAPQPTSAAGTVGRDVLAALEAFDRAEPVWVLGHFDADGLSAMAILTRALERAGWRVRPRIVGRGESPWSPEMAQELADEAAGGVIITDLGLHDTPPRPDVHTLVLDHHLPRSSPKNATVVSGAGMDPIPTSSLLAFWAAEAVGPADDLLWLAALGLIGDMAEGAGFPEMEAARRYGITALRSAVSLVNAPRRSASGDAAPALRLLLQLDGPKPIVAGETADAAALHAAKAEVKAEVDAARRIAPVVRGEVALIDFSSPCQIHPLIAQQWRARLKGEIVMAANHGYRPGFVHFAIRSARDLDLVAFLARHRPPGAGAEYGSGHRQATGGALPAAAWSPFIQSLGFDAPAEAA